ncbi:hypothetical protein HUJ04_004688 [Dendroctonus ponderosae]
MDDHSRTIVHIDIDCFYAQVEMLKEPNLKDKPLGIRQKNMVVTSNYIAREYGIKKCMSVGESKKLCPQLVLVNGEDLYDYRHASQNVSELLQEFSHLVERLGLDENFIDITDLVSKRAENDVTVVGYSFGDKNAISCDCGCERRIRIGSQIAQEIRNTIFEKLQLTTCAGIAHNKILAKVVGSKNKPNKQTVVYPNSASELILSLGSVQNVPWIGQVTAEALRTISINSVEDLQNCSRSQLANIFDPEKALSLLNLSVGIDNTAVKRSGKPQSIGLEDACKLTQPKEVELKFRVLLKRLLTIVNEDGRVPKVLKIVVRKLDKTHPQGGAIETRQSNINIPPCNEEQIIQVAMSLFWKTVDKAKMFSIIGLGLSFSKFVDKPSETNTLTAFLFKNVKPPRELNSEIPVEPNPKRIKLFSSESSSSEANSSVKIECPADVDPDVFKELPFDMQKEIWDDYKSKTARSKCAHTNKSSKKTVQINTLFNYMTRK